MTEKNKKSPLPERTTRLTVESKKTEEKSSPEPSSTEGRQVWMTGTASPNLKKSSETES